MSKVRVESPVKTNKRFNKIPSDLFMGTWYRVAEDDGSTVAYTPDVVTAKFIAEKINEDRRKK